MKTDRVGNFRKIHVNKNKDKAKNKAEIHTEQQQKKIK
jgi:hypothetical protein